MNGQPNHFAGATPQTAGSGYNAPPVQPQGTIYIGFDQPVHVAQHPQAAYGGMPSGAPQHTGYRTPQNGWGWGRCRSTASNAAPVNVSSSGQVAKAKPGPNTLGLVGFVVSLCGLATAAFPVAVAGGALSGLALFRRRRFLAMVGLVMALANPAVVEKIKSDEHFSHHNRRIERAARVELQKQLTQVNTVMAEAESQLVAYFESHGNEWPDGIEGNMLVGGHQDPWGHPLRFDELTDRLVLRSFGPDGQAETKDDVIQVIHHIRSASPAP